MIEKTQSKYPKKRLESFLCRNFPASLQFITIVGFMQMMDACFATVIDENLNGWLASLVSFKLDCNR